jgi:hypothetical protein
MRRRLLISLVLILAIIGIGVSIYWYIACQRLSEAYAAWSAARRAEGWTITAQGQSLAGWPTTATLVLPQFRIAGGAPDIPGGVSWSAERLMLELDLLHSDAVIVRAAGTQQIGPAAHPAYSYTARLFRFVLRRDAPIDINVEALRAGSASMTAGDVHASVALDPAAGRDQGAVSMSLSAHNVGLPQGVNWPLGAHIGALTADAAITGPVPPPSGLAADARTWRDGGGELRVGQLDLHWGPLDAHAHGTLSLDRNLQPVAEGQAVAVNYGPTLDALAARRIIGNDAALAAKAVLSLLSRVPAEGGPAQVEAPFTLRDRTIAVRGIPLAKVPELHWPEGP